MPLTSFAEKPHQIAPELDFEFRGGTPDVDEAAGVADQAMFELGLAGPDRDKNLKEARTDFTKLAGVGYDGLLHILPNRAVTSEHIIATAEGKRPEGVKPFYRFDDLWKPGTEENSYTVDELNDGPAGHAARLAIFSSIQTVYDPALHDLGMPFDSYEIDEFVVNPKNVPTQLEGLEADISAFEAYHKGYTLEELDHRAFAMLTLMDRIRGVETLSQGFMLIP